MKSRPHKGSFVAKVTNVTSAGYHVRTEHNDTIRGVVSDSVWETGLWVTVIMTSEGYSIVGSAGTGPSTSYDPD